MALDVEKIRTRAADIAGKAAQAANDAAAKVGPAMRKVDQKAKGIAMRGRPLVDSFERSTYEAEERCGCDINGDGIIGDPLST